MYKHQIFLIERNELYGGHQVEILSNRKTFINLWPLDGHIFLIERNKPLNGNVIKHKNIYPPNANIWEMNRLNNYYILD
jgi:hypothetical protein